MISIRDLHRRFGDFALDVPSFEVSSGSYAVVLGPSGAGKSLLLKVLAGLFWPDRGTVSIAERDVTNSPPERRRVGLVFQEPSLFPHLRVTENIIYGLKVRGVDRAERTRRLSDLVDRLQLQKLLNRPTATLSGGEAQKVALARALAVEPRVLLLDEPLSQVDQQARLELQGVLQRVHSELGLTVLHVTHNREEALALGQTTAVMLGGQVIQCGATADLLRDPACGFVARFMGSDAEGKKGRELGCTEPCLIGGGCCDRPAGGGDG